MALLVNLLGAIHSFSVSTRTDFLESLNRLTYELYRSLGVIFYTRYSCIQSEKLDLVHRNVVETIQNNFQNPTFDSWVELGKVCSEHLESLGDRLGKTNKSIAELEVDEVEIETIKQVAQELDTSGESLDYKVDFHSILKILRRIYHMHQARVIYGNKLRKIVDMGLRDVLPSIIEKLMSCFPVQVLVPVAFGKKGTEAIVFQSGTFRTEYLPPKSEKPRFIYDCYLRYYEDEEPFSFHTNLLYYEKSIESYCCYRGYIGTEAIYDFLSLEGAKHTQQKEYEFYEDVFDIPVHTVSQYDTYMSFSKRYGRSDTTNGVSHNLPDRLAAYVRRPIIEKELKEKLFRKKFYITTLDGGGGYGKTELAKSVVWDVIESEKSSLPEYLRLDYVVWVTGKIEYFKNGMIESKAQSLGSIEDLIDSILYVTGNYESISRPPGIKRKLVIEALNESNGTLILLDNLETIVEREEIWAYLVELIDSVNKELRVLTTSRIRVGSAELVVTVRRMEDSEARQLTLLEMERLDVDDQWKREKHLAKIVEATGCIPLLIRYAVNLLKRGYTPEEIAEQLPDESDVALRFICDIQWNELDATARKLLTGIAFWGGKITFQQAMRLCKLSDEAFQSAREQLVLRSFLEEQPLVESVLEILPPISKYARLKLQDLPMYEQSFLEAETELRTPPRPPKDMSDQTLDEEVELNRVFQRVGKMLKMGARYPAYDSVKQATDLFPRSSRAWAKRGSFEYRELDNPSEGYASYRQATLNSPTNPDIYEDWADWEFDQGSRKSISKHLKNAKRYYEQALEFTKDDYDRCRLVLSVGKSTLQIGIILSQQLSKTKAEKSKLKHELNRYLVSTVDLLERNLHSPCVGREELFHNAYSHSMMCYSLLLLKADDSVNQQKLEECAIHHLIEGIETDSENQHIRQLFRNNLVIRALGRSGKKMDYKERYSEKVRKTLELKEKVHVRCDEIPAILSSMSLDKEVK